MATALCRATLIASAAARVSARRIASCPALLSTHDNAQRQVSRRLKRQSQQLSGADSAYNPDIEGEAYRDSDVYAAMDNNDIIEINTESFAAAIESQEERELGGTQQQQQQQQQQPAGANTRDYEDDEYDEEFENVAGMPYRH
ncbi:hypothetical protein RI367_006360 [Sorochytrium milnesiophthora]